MNKKSHMIVSIGAGFFAIALVLTSLFACDLMTSIFGRTPDGGAGADFDATQYYTKTEVDDLISSLSYTKTEIDTQIDGLNEDISDMLVWANNSWQSPSDVGWAGRTTSGFTAPEDATGALVEVFINNNSGEDKTFYVCFSPNSEASGLVLQTTAHDGDFETFVGYSYIGSDSRTIYGWHDSDSGHAGAATDLTSVAFKMRPLLWIR